MATKTGNMERNHENIPHLPLEILRMVIGAIVTETARPFKRNLRTAMLVNKTWAAEATRLLWTEVPVDVLLAIKDHDRRQFYACYIQKLSQYCTNEDVMAECSTLDDVEFPRLKCLKVEYYNLANNSTLGVERCIRPSLEEIDTSGILLDEKKCLIYLKSDVQN